MHHTPCHASWLNQVERFFSELARQVLRRGRFASADDLAARVLDFVRAHDETAAPFRWTYDARPSPLVPSPPASA